ncbi:MAG: RagB/SusD family nutrient uptake outer membrane protein [Bacteroidaceae bacterium]|nr:RagB/SusD family nutrient uptake outer membrane protein [Bacteroidaceae bacterium]
MKNLYKSILGAGAMALTLSTMTSCMDETEPTTVVTEDQLATSPSAAKALCMAMPANFNFASFFDSWSDSGHCYFGYGSMMHIRDIMTGDLGESSTNYSHWSNWAQNKYMGQDYLKTQYFWNYFYQFVLATNNTIGSINAETATSEQLGYLGAGYAFRALLYLDMARMFEFLPTDVTDGVNAEGNNVIGLTCPIVKAGMSPAEAGNNPRATHAEMAAFIEEDLNLAEEYIVNLNERANNTLPDLACVYGLKARLYMWNEDYENAAIYARKAIDASSVPVISKERYLDTKTGFNTTSDFLWAASHTSEDWAVQTGIINWTSWLSNQTDFGYTGPSTGLYNIIDAKMYSQISDTDFRKLLYKAPEGSELVGQEPYLIPSMATDEDVPAYTAIKFRPAQGNTGEYSVGAVSAYPVMRVEEMYFIEAEAVAHSDEAKGAQLVEAFMKTYRDPNYVCNTRSVVNDIVFQKRVELWGEGQTFFDIKRLNMSVTRGYEGTNHYSEARLNTNGRPAWMNIVIVQTEKNNNEALDGWNNPDPSDLYTPWTGE